MLISSVIAMTKNSLQIILRFSEHIGDFQYAEALARKADIPEDLILNYSVRKFMGFLGER